MRDGNREHTTKRYSLAWTRVEVAISHLFAYHYTYTPALKWYVRCTHTHTAHTHTPYTISRINCKTFHKIYRETLNRPNFQWPRGNVLITSSGTHSRSLHSIDRSQQWIYAQHRAGHHLVIYICINMLIARKGFVRSRDDLRRTFSSHTAETQRGCFVCAAQCDRWIVWADRILQKRRYLEYVCVWRRGEELLLLVMMMTTLSWMRRWGQNLSKCCCGVWWWHSVK